MVENQGPRLRDLIAVPLRDASDEQLARLKNMSDDDLLRSSSSIDLFAIAESMRRLKGALHKEEVAIKRLTVVLVVLTVILVIQGVLVLGR